MGIKKAEFCAEYKAVLITSKLFTKKSYTPQTKSQKPSKSQKMHFLLSILLKPFFACFLVMILTDLKST